MPYVIGVDTGGTFTDGFVADHLGRLSSAKSPSTPPDFSVGFLTVIDDLAKSLGATTKEFLRDASYIVHGTTSTLNALVTGDVCKVGFLTTKGHADSISIMNVEGRKPWHPRVFAKHHAHRQHADCTSFAQLSPAAGTRVAPARFQRSAASHAGLRRLRHGPRSATPCRLHVGIGAHRWHCWLHQPRCGARA